MQTRSVIPGSNLGTIHKLVLMTLSEASKSSLNNFDDQVKDRFSNILMQVKSIH